jgi:site-specific DNA-cytosine methylase
MKVLVACERSGVVRDAFRRQGHDAISCDIEPTVVPGPHLKCDVREIDTDQYDLVIAHPPCTDLCASGARWWGKKKDRQAEAIEFFLWFTRIEKPCAIENPIGIMSREYRKPDQIIQPWQFGHGETKATCLWLNKLPPLKPTKIVAGRESRIHRMSQSKDRAFLRSVTYPGIAEAMASQWSAK